MSTNNCLSMEWSKKIHGGQEVADKVRSTLEKAVGKSFQEYKAIDYIKAPDLTPGIPIAPPPVVFYVINVEVEVNTLYYHLSVQQRTDRDLTTTLLGFTVKKSKDAHLVPLHVFDSSGIVVN